LKHFKKYYFIVLLISSSAPLAAQEFLHSFYNLQDTLKGKPKTISKRNSPLKVQFIDSLRNKSYVLFNYAGALETMRQYTLPIFYKWPSASEIIDFLVEKDFKKSFNDANYNFLDASGDIAKLHPGTKIWAIDHKTNLARIVYKGNDLVAEYTNPDHTQTGALMCMVPSYSKSEFIRANQQNDHLFYDFISPDERKAFYYEIIKAISYAYCYDSIGSNVKFQVYLDFEDEANNSSVYCENNPTLSSFLTKVVQEWRLTSPIQSQIIISQTLDFEYSAKETVVNEISMKDLEIFEKKNKYLRKGYVEFIERNSELKNFDNVMIADKCRYSKYYFKNKRMKNKFFANNLNKLNEKYLILWNNYSENE